MPLRGVGGRATLQGKNGETWIAKTSSLIKVSAATQKKKKNQEGSSVRIGSMRRKVIGGVKRESKRPLKDKAGA